MLPPWRRFEPLPLASKLARLGATVIDLLVIAPFVAAAAVLAARREAYPALVPGAGTLFVLFYQSQLMAATGQTLGKRALGIQVVLRDGSKIESFTVVMRMWLPILIIGAPVVLAAVLVFGGAFLSAWGPSFDSWLGRLPTTQLSAVYMIFCVVMYAASIFSEDNRTFADRLAGTEVVVAPTPSAPVKHWRMLLFSLALVVPVFVVTLVVAIGSILFFAANIYFRWVGPNAR